MTLCRPSSSLGMSSITSAPASGRKTMRVRPQSVRNSLLSMGAEPWPRPSDEDDEGAGEHGDRSEEQGAVLLDLAGRELAGGLAPALGGGRPAAHPPAHHPPADVRVDETPPG